MRQLAYTMFITDARIFSPVVKGKFVKTSKSLNLLWKLLAGKLLFCIASLY